MVMAVTLVMGPVLLAVLWVRERCVGRSSLAKESLSSLTFTVFRSLVIQGNLLFPQETQLRIIFFFWYLFCFIIYGEFPVTCFPSFSSSFLFFSFCFLFCDIYSASFPSRAADLFLSLLRFASSLPSRLLSLVLLKYSRGFVPLLQFSFQFVCLLCIAVVCGGFHTLTLILLILRLFFPSCASFFHSLLLALIHHLRSYPTIPASECLKECRGEGPRVMRELRESSKAPTKVYTHTHTPRRKDQHRLCSVHGYSGQRHLFTLHPNSKQFIRLTFITMTRLFQGLHVQKDSKHDY